MPTGSSPRLWGIRVSRAQLRGKPRFIPTPVGHTSVNRYSLMNISVHPHACGAYIERINSPLVLSGSSPRLWGIRRNGCNQHLDIRFIPTPVGHTYSEALSTAPLAVHPHACGAYKILCNHCNADCGSSPRLWGIPALKQLKHHSIRFIPTPVGHTYR